MFGASLHVGWGTSARTVCNADTVAEVKPAAQAAGQPDAQPSLQPDGHPQLRPTGPRPGASPEAPARLGPPPLVRAFKILSIIAGNFLTVAVQNFIIFEYFRVSSFRMHELRNLGEFVRSSLLLGRFSLIQLLKTESSK